MAILTRDEAVRRGELVRPSSTAIELDLRDPLSDTFTSRTTIEFSCAEPGADTFLDLACVEVLEITLNDRTVSGDLLVDDRIRLEDLQTDNTVVVQARMAFSSDGEGLHRHLDPADGEPYLYAMSFLDAGPRWFACFDQPDLKFTCTMSVRTPRGWTVLGNGRFQEVEPGLWRMSRTPPLSSYFVTIAAGPFASVGSTHDGITLGVHARASLAAELPGGLAEQAEDIIEVTAQGFDAYHELFGIRNPFGDYHQVFVPDFNAGAMENPGCVTLREQYLFRGRATAAQRASRAGTVVHELAHQWFGDLVTMTWWDDLWLNESFAELMAHWVCTEWTRYPLWVEFGIQRKDWGAVVDQGPNTHPVAGNGARDTTEALASFDGISYAKGAGLLKQLLARIGTETFLAGVRDHLERFRFGNARLDDLLAAWRRAGAHDINSWAEAWLSTSGMDELRVGLDRRHLRVDRIPGPGTDRPHAMDLVGLDDTGGVRHRQPVEIAEDSVVLTPGEGAEELFWVLDAEDVAWARLRPSRPLEQWPGLSAIENPATRVSLWNSLRDAVRHGEVDPRAALQVVCSELMAEPELVIVESVFGWALSEPAGAYLPEEERGGWAGRLAGLADQRLRDAEAASDAQLSAWRCLLGSLTDHDRLAGFLSGQGIPDGCDLDAELRWSVVRRLAALAEGPAEVAEARAVIEQTAERDLSTAGRVARARAIASLPDPETKQRVFEILMHPSELSAYEVYACAEGFFAGGQGEVTAAWVPRYFAEIGATASFRRGWSLSRVVQSAFPAFSSTPQTLRLAEQALAEPGLDEGVRRPLVQATHQLRQAVRSRSNYENMSTAPGL